MLEEESAYGSRCSNCGKRGLHYTKDCPHPCGNCGTTGHLIAKCPQRPTKASEHLPGARALAARWAKEAPQPSASEAPPVVETAHSEPEAAPEASAPMSLASYLVHVLQEHGYTVAFREDVWWEAFIARAGENWLGAGNSQDEALETGVRAMCGASHLGRAFLDAAIAARATKSPEELAALRSALAQTGAP